MKKKCCKFFSQFSITWIDKQFSISWVISNKISNICTLISFKQQNAINFFLGNTSPLKNLKIHIILQKQIDIWKYGFLAHEHPMVSNFFIGFNIEDRRN